MLKCSRATRSYSARRIGPYATAATAACISAAALCAIAISDAETEWGKQHVYEWIDKEKVQ
jgi:hypothetical protein